MKAASRAACSRVAGEITTSLLPPARTKATLLSHPLIPSPREGLFNAYQSSQSRPVFECDHIVSFAEMENIVPAGPGGYGYDLDEVTGFEELKWRVVINRG